ncbi:MAG: patatin-like phospholipase family protein [Deltaproteobacteria bacterium]|nr:patatin-like phospholipase family protein [Deltaproteobacteria bacterium]MCL5278140.1 patatin-like phospholipase family protein [Deltaproteobacteria bacterium]
MEERRSKRLHILNRLKSFIKREKARTIGIALGGGVVWGTAHIGVLEAISAEGIKIDAIAGTSAGSIVAALYAFGIDLDRIKSYAEKLSMSDIFKLRLPRMGLASTEGIGRLIREFIGDAKIEDADIPLYIPATDLTASEPHLFEKVSVADAVMASSAIPGIFVPVKMDGHTYVDGSLLADVPCQILKIKGIDFVIGVELIDKEKFKREPSNIFDVITKSIQVMVNETRMERLRFADVIITPDVHDIGQFDFDRIPLLIRRGKEAVSKHVEFIKSRAVAS